MLRSQSNKIQDNPPLSKKHHGTWSPLAPRTGSSHSCLSRNCYTYLLLNRSALLSPRKCSLVPLFRQICLQSYTTSTRGRSHGGSSGKKRNVIEKYHLDKCQSSNLQKESVIHPSLHSKLIESNGLNLESFQSKLFRGNKRKRESVEGECWEVGAEGAGRKEGWERGKKKKKDKTFHSTAPR